VPLGVGWALGALVGSRVDDARGPLHVGRHRHWLAVRVVTAAVAVALFLYFLPVWMGIPLDEALIRQRWWLDGWI
jgi:dolichyl-phosphate-mannose-protein mannosyltransferase